MIVLPNSLKQGERARLIPVLADTSREKRIASIFLSLLPQVPGLAADLFGSLNVRVGKRSNIETFTEIVLSGAQQKDDRPDGLVNIKNSKKDWPALFEVKI